MAFNKIQPEQIQLATFFSNSGDIAINQTDTGVRLNLSRSITGNFNFTGDGSRPFKVNEKPVLALTQAADSSYTFESGSFAINGSVNTLMSGINNVGINVQSVNSSGNASNNTVINGESSTIGSGAQDCFAVGRQVTFTNPTTGAVVFSDFAGSNPAETKGNDSFLVDFTGGSYFEGGKTYHLNDVHVSASTSGLYSGDLNVLGDTFMGTSTVITRWSGQTINSQSGSMMVSGDKLAVYLLGAWYGIGTADMTAL